MLIDKGPYDDREVDVNGSARRLYMGGVLGGGTSLYGGALIRPSEQDFQPGRYYGKRIPRAIWDWPISYADLEPHYTEAERLYGVAGCGDEDFSPAAEARPRLSRESPCRCIRSTRGSSPPIANHGLHPFRLPLAIDSSRCLRCGVCAGYVCPTGARSSAAQLLERATPRAIPSGSGPRSKWSAWQRNAGTGSTVISVLDRATGQRSTYRARRYVLGAGAIGSSLLLLRSGLGGIR